MGSRICSSVESETFSTLPWARASGAPIVAAASATAPSSRSSFIGASPQRLCQILSAGPVLVVRVEPAAEVGRVPHRLISRVGFVAGEDGQGADLGVEARIE